MTDLDLTAFHSGAEAHRSAMAVAAGVERDHRQSWETSLRADHEAYFDRRALAPSSMSPDRWMKENHPDLAAAYEKVETALSAYVDRRDAAIVNVLSAKRDALQGLGTAFRDHWTQEALSATEDAGFQNELDQVLAKATALRQEHLDKGHLDLDPNGVFTKTLFSDIVSELSIDGTKKTWLHATLAELSARRSSPVPSQRGF